MHRSPIHSTTMDQIDKQLLKGSMATILLSVLSRKEMYGYEIIKAVEKETDGGFQPKEGTIYPILHELESEGAISARWYGGVGARERKYYRITAAGRKLLERKRNDWLNFRTVVDRFLSRSCLKEEPA